MTVKVNGQDRDVPAGTSVLQLIEQHNLTPQKVGFRRHVPESRESGRNHGSRCDRSEQNGGETQSMMHVLVSQKSTVKGQE